MKELDRKDTLLGIDLGTSSLKLLAVQDGSRALLLKETYAENTPAGWTEALADGLSRLSCEIDTASLRGIGLSSQTGTYIVYRSDGESPEVIPWNSPKGREELVYLKKTIPQEVFLEETGMEHPDLVSYPGPRLLAAAKEGGKIKRICQPKDILAEFLTGRPVSDPYTWRGIADASKRVYSRKILAAAGVECTALPHLVSPDETAGETSERIKEKTGIPAGIPVFAGLNDFFAALLGMGAVTPGTMFDITGTSEHIGKLIPSPKTDTRLISGPFLRGAVLYGVTASSGSAWHLSREYAGEKAAFEDCFPETGCRTEKLIKLLSNAPVFLPYLNGERAPIYDPQARGVFFGLGENCGREEMSYAAMEGMVFSLKQIAEEWDGSSDDTQGCMIAGGGLASANILNRLKAEILGKTVIVPEEQESSALGAAIIAAHGLTGTDYAGLKQIFCREKTRVAPTLPGGSEIKKKLRQRYELYVSLYPRLKEQFGALAKIRNT